MCGIAGLVSLSGPLAPEVRGAIHAMTGRLAHRGPDGDGFHVEEGVALGHRRLAIIDVAGGRQPLANEDESIWIVFNGEVYNHHPLRERLEARGHRFRTRSDTEAIVHAYEEFGEACVEHLQGMFAFAIWDRERRRLFAARDRLGKKPLFFATLGGVLHFASEIKAIAASPCWNDEVDLSALEGYLSLGYFLAPATVYRHVHKLQPGHWLSLQDGRLETRRYWDVTEFDTDLRPVPAVVDDLEALLRDAVASRLESEVPLGAFLSGGLDSGVIVSLMAETHKAELVTTSVGFGEAEHNELGPAGLTAARYRTTHHAEVVEPALDQVLDRVVGCFDEPFADSSAIPTYYVSGAARRYVTVALSGDGGDESFGGYDFRYLPHAWEQRLRRWVPGAAGRAALAWLGARWPRSGRLPRPLRLGNVLENLSDDSATAYYADLCFLKPWDVRALMGRPGSRDPRDSPVFDQVTACYRRCESPSVLQRAQYADLTVYLPNDPLVKVDRTSMAHSLEVRCPLLDYRVVEFAFRVPTGTKLAGLEPKHLLKQVARRRLPAEVLTMPKRGFTAPVGTWIAGSCADRYAREVLSGGSFVSSHLDVALVRRWFDEHRRGETDRSYALWALWMLESWAAARTRPAEPAPAGSG